MRTKLLVVAGLLSVSSIYASSIPLSQVTGIVAFGDSLSDNGNAAFALGGTLPGNYAPNAFTDGTNTTPGTNGPLGVWVDQFAAKAGLPDPQPFLSNPLSGTNVAVGLAHTGSADPQDISNQVSTFSAAHPFGIPSNALYTIWGGANDLLDMVNDPKTAADNLYSNILTLSGEGAKFFLWLNLPQLGDVPVVKAQGPAAIAALNAASSAFNAEWTVDLSNLQSQGINVVGLNIGSLFSQIIADPTAFGLQNATGSAQGQAVDPNKFLFWDGLHPTTAGHALVADFAFDNLATPEPFSAGLALMGLFGVAAVLKLRRHQNR